MSGLVKCRGCDKETGIWNDDKLCPECQELVAAGKLRKTYIRSIFTVKDYERAMSPRRNHKGK